MRSTSFLACMSMILVACGGKVGSTTDAGDTGTPPDPKALLLAYCDSEVTHATKCGETFSASELADCKKAAPCIGSLYRADAVALIVTCLEARACGAREQACLESAAAAITPSATYTSLKSECLAKAAACGLATTTCTAPSSSDAVPSPLMTDSVLSDMRACGTQPCSTYTSCLSSAATKAVAPCASTPVDPPPIADAGTR